MDRKRIAEIFSALETLGLDESATHEDVSTVYLRLLESLKKSNQDQEIIRAELIKIVDAFEVLKGEKLPLQIGTRVDEAGNPIPNPEPPAPASAPPPPSPRPAAASVPAPAPPLPPRAVKPGLAPPEFFPPEPPPGRSFFLKFGLAVLAAVVIGGGLREYQALKRQSPPPPAAPPPAIHVPKTAPAEQPVEPIKKIEPKKPKKVAARARVRRTRRLAKGKPARKAPQAKKPEIQRDLQQEEEASMEMAVDSEAEGLEIEPKKPRKKSRIMGIFRRVGNLIKGE